jgi:hypothetical protein
MNIPASMMLLKAIFVVFFARDRVAVDLAMTIGMEHSAWTYVE